MENFKLSAQTVAAVAYERRSPVSDSSYSDYTEKIGILEMWSLTGGGRLREVVVCGGSTVLTTSTFP